MSTAALTVTGAVLEGESVGLRCVDGTIAALGPGVAPEPGDETIDAAGAPLVTPLLNGHTHAAMTLFRGYSGDLPLMRWLREVIWPVEARLEAEDVYWGTRLACLEMIRTGTARFWDMYWHPGATARAVTDSGLRATIGGPLFDLDGKTEAMQAMALDCVAEHGVRPSAYLDRLGALNERTILAHGVWLDEEELALIAARGCTVVTNPVANMKLAVGGVFPYPAAREAGVGVGVGTDGAGSNDSLDLLADLKLFALAQRHATGDTTVVGGAVLMRGGEVPGAEEVVTRALERSRRLGIGA